MNTLIETSRCLMRKIVLTDVQDLFELDSDPLVTKYLGESVKSVDESAKSVEYIQKQYADNGIGRYAVIEKSTGEFMGWSGLKLETKVRDFDYYDIGYRFKPQYWGKGIATETALASVEYGFQVLGLNEISGAADVNNIASNVVLKKAGLEFVEQFQYMDIPHNWYSISKGV